VLTLQGIYHPVLIDTKRYQFGFAVCCRFPLQPYNAPQSTTYPFVEVLME
jgi:hypothetical protein